MQKFKKKIQIHLANSKYKLITYNLTYIGKCSLLNEKSEQNESKECKVR